jgi:lipopolysaccharide transport system permease protein
VSGPAARHWGELIWELVLRDLRLRYRRSVLGLAWSQLGPLTTMLVLSFVFTRVIPLHIDHYPVFVFSGLLAWTWFQGGIVAATESVVTGRDLARRPGFPVSLLPAAAVASHLMHFLLAVPVLLLFILIATGHLFVTLVALPLVVITQFLVILAPAYLLSALDVRFRDVSHLLSIALVPLFYATPVFYALSSVPHRFRLLYDLNPLSRLLDEYRAVLLSGEWGDLWGLLALAAVAVIGLAACLRLFDAASYRFAEEL